MNRLSISRRAVLVCILLTGCGSRQEPSVTGRGESRPLLSIDLNTAATLAGRVSFTGTPPKRAQIDMSANPACERQHRKPPLTELAVVNANRTLRNTFIWIKSGLPEGRWDPPILPARLDQDGCVYTPHMLGIMVGQPLEITNSDPVNHNVHAEASANVSWSESQPPRAEKKIKTFTKEEVLFPVTCGVHPWMRAYIGVVSNPFYAVTGDDGSFTIPGLPPGSYTVEAVHETYGRKESHVTVAPRERKEVEFTYAGS